MTSIPARSRAYLAGLVPGVPRQVWAVVLGQLLSSVGTGFVLPFGTIYLHFVRGIPIPTVGAIVSTVAAGGLATTLAGGRLVDRVGAKTMLLAGIAFQAAGFAVFAVAVSAPTAFLAALLVGVGNGVFFPALGAAMAEMTDPSQRSGTSSLQYMAINVGIGAGSVAGGLIVSIQHPLTFVAVYLANAASFAGFGVLLALWVHPQRAAAERPAGDEVRGPDGPRGYRAVLADRAFASLVLFNLVAVALGYAQLDSNFPLYARTYLGVQPAALGGILAVNTALIVVAQLPVARAVRALRRTRVLALFAGTWTAAWLIGLGASYLDGAPAALALGACAAVFGLGECLLSCSLMPLGMDLSPVTSRGAYMGAVSISWSAGLMLGPAAGSLLVGSAAHRGFWAVLAAGCLGLVGFTGILRRVIPPSIDRPPEPA